MAHFFSDGRSLAPLCRRLLTLALFAAVCTAAAGDASAQSPLETGSPDLVISQVYTRGGETGAAFRNDYVEIFNRGNTTANLLDYSIQVLVNVQPQPTVPPVLVAVTTRFVSSSGSFPLPPGQYKLLAF